MNVDVANNLVSIIVGVLGVIGTLIGFVAWFIRLESKVKYLEKDHQRVSEESKVKETTVWSKMDTMQATLNQVLQGVGELKGRIEK